MYRFICDHVVPGCSHVDEDKSQEKLMERVAIHLREHHNLEHSHDTPLDEVLKRTVIPIV